MRWVVACRPVEPFSQKLFAGAGGRPPSLLSSSQRSATQRVPNYDRDISSLKFRNHL